MIDWKETLNAMLGIEYIDFTDNVLTATMPVKPNNCQIYGTLHGGASLAMAEGMAGEGSRRLCSDKEFPVGVTVSGNHISAVTIGHTVTAKAILLHKGRRTHVWNVDIRTEDGRLVSTVRVVNQIIQRR